MALILQDLLRGSLGKIPSIVAIGAEGSHNTCKADLRVQLMVQVPL